MVSVWTLESASPRDSDLCAEDLCGDCCLLFDLVLRSGREMEDTELEEFVCAGGAGWLVRARDERRGVMVGRAGFTDR